MPPMFNNTDKFDGMNWPTWSNNILSITALRGVSGYLDGTITKPTKTPTKTPPETSWNSLNPSKDKWEIRNAWAKILLTFNTKNPVRLGINVNGTAADTWESYKSNYETASDMTRQNTEQELRNITFSDGDDFQNHVTIMRNKLSQARALGADITDKNFKTILLNSLPSLWDPVIASLYKNIPISETISQLQVWWLRINWNRPANSHRSVAALQTNTYNTRDKLQLICANPSCRRHGHTIDICYWPGGGKEGQFPPGFGRRGSPRGVATNTQYGGFKQRPTANNTTAENANDKEVLALMTMGDTNYEVTTTPLPGTPNFPNKSISNSSNTTSELGYGNLGVRVSNGDPNINLVMFNSMQNKLSNVPTLIDSGASDHCFTNKEFFVTLALLPQPTIGLAAGKESIFKVLGKGKAKILVTINGSTKALTFENALYTPELWSNLISVSKLGEKGAKVYFDKQGAQIKAADGMIVMKAKRLGQLYEVEVEKQNPTIYVTQTKRRSVLFNTWHRRLGHIGAETVHEMVNKNLVDGLNISGELTMRGRCEDCIFGKHSTHPSNDKGYRETNVLERIHIDIWGPAQIQSAGGASYFMLLMDGYSSYRTIALLKSKSVDTTLHVFKTYYVKAERQTGKKLRRVRLDMGREWYNKTWEEYRREQGLIFEFTTPYTHQQNGTAERSMRTILDGARTAMAELGLPQKYWADAIQTTVYTQNFVLSSRNPGLIPAELWHGKRQDISHLRPFGTTAYTHIPGDLNLSKLYPRSVKTSLLGYFGCEGYKLLERETGSVFRSCDVIFEEGDTNLTTSTINPYPDYKNDFSIVTHEQLQSNMEQEHNKDNAVQNNPETTL